MLKIWSNLPTSADAAEFARGKEQIQQREDEFLKWKAEYAQPLATKICNFQVTEDPGQMPEHYHETTEFNTDKKEFLQAENKLYGAYIRLEDMMREDDTANLNWMRDTFRKQRETPTPDAIILLDEGVYNVYAELANILIKKMKQLKPTQYHRYMEFRLFPPIPFTFEQDRAKYEQYKRLDTSGFC